jgi:mono/diheme cytochrome c family protein
MRAGVLWLGMLGMCANAHAADEGQRLYARHCLSCHQADGYGVPNMQPAITGGPWVQGDPRALAMFVLTGGFDSAQRKESESHNVMPSFAQLPDADLAAILTFIREKFGEGASPVGVEIVAAARSELPGGK